MSSAAWDATPRPVERQDEIDELRGCRAAAVRSSLDNHNGKTVTRVGEGMPARWGIRA